MSGRLIFKLPTPLRRHFFIIHHKTGVGFYFFCRIEGWETKVRVLIFSNQYYIMPHTSKKSSLRLKPPDLFSGIIIL